MESTENKQVILKVDVEYALDFIEIDHQQKIEKIFNNFVVSIFQNDFLKLILPHFGFCHLYAMIFTTRLLMIDK